jgi:hypothetical protein
MSLRNQQMRNEEDSDEWYPHSIIEGLMKSCRMLQDLKAPITGIADQETTEATIGNNNILFTYCVVNYLCFL